MGPDTNAISFLERELTRAELNQMNTGFIVPLV